MSRISRIPLAVAACAATLLASPAGAAIEGYCWPLSAAPGEVVSFMVSSSTDFSVTFARYERSGDSNTSIPVTSPMPVTGVEQPVPADAWEGCGWNTSFQFAIPNDWASGIYGAECSAPGTSTFRVTFVVKPRPDDRGDFAVLANTNTWNAYNKYGGRSKYTNPPAHYCSFLRPNSSARANGAGPNHVTRAELWVLDWLADSGYRVDVYADRDFHLGIPDFQDYRALILNTHPEYWTHEMYDRLEAYLAGGGSVLYAGGNGVYERVVFSPDGTVLEAFPQNFCGDLSCRRESFFRNHDPPRCERAVLGVAYRSDGFQTYAPFEVLQAGHRFFDGTGVQNGDPVGAAGLNGGGASGWEMDTSIPGPAPDGVMVSAYGSDDRGSPPPNLELLARGTNEGGYGADMTYYETGAGGGVFAAGSLSFGGSLVVDPVLQQVVRNVLDEFLSGPLAVGAPAGSAAGARLSCAPNPFAGATTLRFERPPAGRVRLAIFDVTGRRVRTLLDGNPGAGAGSATWDGRDDGGRPVGAGVYVARLEAGGAATTRRMLRVR